jgi:hypothetical protein
VVDHVVPHKGDWTEFVTGELQSVCEPCHNSVKRQIELRGYCCDVGIRSNHPFNRAGESGDLKQDLAESSQPAQQPIIVD